MFAVDLELGGWLEDLAADCNVAILSFRDLIVTLSVEISEVRFWSWQCGQ